MSVLESDLFKQACYINGAWVAADSGKTVDVTNPSNGAVLGTVPYMEAAETTRAIEAANAALPGWRAQTAKQRHAVLHRWFQLMTENSEALGTLLTLEQGKPLAEAVGEIAYAASFFEWFAEEAKRINGETIPGHQPDKRITVLKQAVGVVGAITPWNFPSAMITRKAGAALAAGCTMVCKPATQTPYSALALAVLAEQAGVPAGVFNVITGSARDIGGVLTSNPVVRKITFTGSTETGALLMAQSAPTVKKMSLELGGNAPFIVFDDADLDAAVAGAIVCKYRNNGQTCVCANRIYVQDGVYEAFTARLKTAVSALKVGDGMTGDAALGPLIDRAAVDKVKEHIADALAKGAKTVLGGTEHALGGLFFEPTILSGVTKDMAVTHEETFGPIAPLYRFKDEADVISQANDTQFGLASYFYANDLRRVYRVAEALEYGIVGVNTGIISTETAPFGGVKSSGLGREGSSHGIDDYLELKYVCMGGME